MSVKFPFFGGGLGGGEGADFIFMGARIVWDFQAKSGSSGSGWLFSFIS